VLLSIHSSFYFYFLQDFDIAAWQENFETVPEMLTKVKHSFVVNVSSV
jgi:hypothetical protein